MADYEFPTLTKPEKVKKNQVLLVASGDLRLVGQSELLGGPAGNGTGALARPWRPPATNSCGPIPTSRRRSTASSARRRKAWTSFASIDPGGQADRGRGGLAILAPCALRAASAHEGPMLTVANWSGTWPGLVGMLNLNGSLTKAGRKYSTLWSEDFTDKYLHAASQVAGSRKARIAAQDRPRARGSSTSTFPAKERRLGAALAAATAPRKGHHGRVRRRLHGHVQRHHSRPPAASHRRLSRNGSASRPCTTRRRKPPTTRPGPCASGWNRRA